MPSGAYKQLADNQEDIRLQEDSLFDSLNQRSDQLTTTFSEDEPFSKNSIPQQRPNWRNSWKLCFQISLCFLNLYIIGLSDQTIGTLLPSLLETYDTTQYMISLIFVLAFSGYTTAALTNSKLHYELGRQGVLMLGMGSLVFVYAFIAAFGVALPLWLFICLFYIIGFGVGIADAAIGVYLANVEDSNEIMGILHGFYGLGGMCAPPSISWIMNKYGNDHYWIFYSVLCGFSFGAFIGVLFAFDGLDKESYREELRVSKLASRLESEEVEENEDQGQFLYLLKDPLILAFCFYLFFYIGAEISISSWCLTYLLTIHKLEQLQASFVISWFWIGLTLGRVVLGFVTKWFRNVYRANWWYSILSALTFGMFTLYTLMISYNHNTQSLNMALTKILICLAGIFIGPLFPTSNITLTRIVPAHYQVAAVGLYTSLGGCGSAILPFIVGNFAKGVIGFEWVMFLTWLIIISYCVVWWRIPSVKKTRFSGYRY